METRGTLKQIVRVRSTEVPLLRRVKWTRLLASTATLQTMSWFHRMLLSILHSSRSMPGYFQRAATAVLSLIRRTTTGATTYCLGDQMAGSKLTFILLTA